MLNCLFTWNPLFSKYICFWVVPSVRLWHTQECRPVNNKVVSCVIFNLFHLSISIWNLLPLYVLPMSHIMSTHLMCARNCKTDSNIQQTDDCCKYRALPNLLSAGSPLASLCVSAKMSTELQASWQLSWRCLPHHSPAPCYTHIHLSAKPEPPTVALLLMQWCFLYHVCQWAISLWAFWLQPLHNKKEVC